MRQAGKLPSEEQARRFVDYLLTKKVPARADADNGEFAIWIHEEDHFQEARRELETFRDEPQHERYKAATKEADSIRTEKIKRVKEAQKRVTNMQSQWERPTSRGAKPLTMALIVISVIVFIMTYMMKNETVYRTLLFADPIHFIGTSPTGTLDATVFENKLVDLRGGQIWRTVTPMFLHGDPMHIAFNMLLMFQLGSLLEPRMGTPKYGLLVLITGFASITLTVLMPIRLVIPFTELQGANVIGMSGVVFGLIGYLWGRTLTQPFMDIMLRPTIFTFSVVYIAIGVSGILDRLLGISISNWAHLIGLLAGLAIAYFEHALRKK